MKTNDDKQEKTTVSSTQKPRWSLLKNDWFYGALFGVLTVVLFGEFLFSDLMLSSSDQISGIDSRVVLHDAITKFGQFPTWMPSRLGGMPSIDAMFGDAMYPLSLAFYAIFPLHRAFGHIMVIHVFLAGLFFYLMLVRGFRLHPIIGFVAATFYMLNPEFVSHVYPGHSGKMMIIAWLPFVVWRLKVLLETPSLIRASFFAFGIAICLFTSHIQMTYFMLWGLFLYWVVAMVLEWRRTHSAFPIFVRSAYFWVAIFFGVGMAFIQFFPSFMFVRDAFSVRGIDRGFEHAASWSLHWPEFFSLWIPQFGGYLESYWSENYFKLNTEYAGAMVSLLAILAVAIKPGKWRIFWAAIAALAVLYSMGAHTPVFHIAYYLIPGVKKFRACSMIMFWFSFAVSLLAALLLSDVLKGEFSSLSDAAKKKLNRLFISALVGSTLLCLLFSAKSFVASLMQNVLADPNKSRVFDQNFSANFIPALWLWWMMAMVTIGLLWAVMHRKVSAAVFVTVVLFIGLFDTFRTNAPFIEVVNPRRYMGSDRTLDELHAQMANAPFRCFVLPGTLGQNAEGIYGLEGISGFHDNELRWYREFRGDQQDKNFFNNLLLQDAQGQPYLDVSALQRGNSFLNLANVRYYVSRQNGRTVTLENTGALGRLSFVANYTVMPEAEIGNALTGERYDIRTTVALLEEPLQKPSSTAPKVSGAAVVDSLTKQEYPQAQVRWEKYTVNYRKAQVTAPQDGFLRISEVYYPGWEVRIDGVKSKVYQADLAWMAVYIAQGEHTIEMMPKSLYLAKASIVSFPLISLLLLYWLVASLIRLKAKNKKA